VVSQFVIMQVYMLPLLLTLTADKNAPVWKGIVLALFLFIATAFWNITFPLVTTIGKVSGLRYNVMSTTCHEITNYYYYILLT